MMGLMESLEIYHKIHERINTELLDSEEYKKTIFNEVQHESTLVATLRLHLYAEKELNELIKTIFLHSKTIIDKQSFSGKINLLYNLGVMDKSLFDAVLRLNKVRNGFAHQLEYENSKDYYTELKSGLSGLILEHHEIDVKMRELLHGEMSDDTKFRLLLAGIWIQLRLFSTSILLKKFDFARRLQEEVVEELDIEANDEK